MQRLRQQRIEAVGGDVVQQDRQREPETGALDGAFGLEGEDGAVGDIHGVAAVLLDEVGGDAAKLAGARPPDRRTPRNTA